MGGKAVFTTMLDSVFSLPPVYDNSYYGFTIHEIREMQIMNMGNYAHGNQPIQHALYLYNWAGQPWKAQQRIRQVMDRFYNAQPDGYCGDEDNGQTSAWYVFSALGFYPVCPGSNEYALGTPYFRWAVLHLPGGHDVTISAPACSAANRYISAMTLNGQPWTRNYLRHDDLMRGATIVFDMDSKPSHSRGTTPDDVPYSLSQQIRKQ